MEYNSKGFIERLKQYLYDSFPYESSTQFRQHHKNRSGSFKDIAFKNNNIIHLGNNNYAIELGNAKGEEETPQYHILEDAEVIYKRGKGTRTSKGSQASITNLGQRDYGIATIKRRTSKSGKQIDVLSQEYRKNCRGERSRSLKAQRTITDYNGNLFVINRNARYYKNEHYHYIEKSLEEIVIPKLCNDFNLKRQRTKISNRYEDNDMIRNDEMYSNELEDLYSM